MAEVHVFDPRPEEPPAQLPPHNIPVEQALLGAILVNNEALHLVSSFLLPDHFYEPAHGRIYAAAAKLIEAGRRASTITMALAFDGDPGLADVGGSEYLGRLAASIVSVMDAEDYGRTIFDLYRRRALMEHADGLRGLAGDPNTEASADDMLREAAADLDRIGEGGPDRGEDVSIVEAAAETVAHTEAIATGRATPGIQTELKALDRKLGGLKPDALIVIAARPSMGKTALAARIAVRAASQGHAVHYFSLEEGRRGISSRLLSARTGIPYEDILNGRADDSQIAQLSQAAGELPGSLRISERGDLTLEQIRHQVLQRHRREPLGLVLVDHLGLMRAPRHLERADRRHHIEYFTKGLKALAKEIAAPVIALSQLNRQVEQRDDKRPRLADLRESGSIEQDADVVMFVYREEYYVLRSKPRAEAEMPAWEIKRQQAENTVDIIIDKNRHGSIGSVPLFCQIAFNRFGDIERREVF